MLKLYLLLKKIDYNTIILNSPKDLKTAGIISFFLKKRKIIYRRGSAIPVKNTFINRFLLNVTVTHIIANTVETKNTILQNFKKENFFPSLKKKVTVIYNGINVNSIPTSKKSQQIFSKNNTDFVIGNAGRLVNQKRQDLLIDLAVNLKKKGYNIKILIAGEGKNKSDLIKYSHEKNVQDMVHFLGYVENMGSFYKNIDVFVLTSQWEGFGYVLAEAMLFKNPVVAFDISSNPELITDGINGYLVEYEDIEKLTEKIILLQKNKSIRNQMGEAGYQIVLEKFDSRKMQLKLEALIKSV